MDLNSLGISDVGGWMGGDSWGSGSSWWGNLGATIGGIAQGWLGAGQRQDMLGLSLPQGTSTNLPGRDVNMQRAFGPGTRGIVVVPQADGRLTFWRSAGRPMLWSGDLAAVKRVRRAASKAGARVGRRGGR